MADAQKKPLEHLKIVDLTVNVPGPFCSMILADLGAEVIKVEPPGGDPLRHSEGMFASLNRGKQSIVLDLKSVAGREALKRLAAEADVVLEGSRPGVAERLGADSPTLSSGNPALVYCSISGFGQDGPWRDRPGHDINYLSLGGYLGVQTAVEGRPWPPPVLISDLASGLYAAISVLAAICGRQASGKGVYIDLSMTESVLSLLGPEIGRTVADDASEGQPNVTYIPHYGLFPCADGRWMSLGIVHEDHFWDRFCKAVGLDDLAALTFDERIAQASSVRDRLHALFLSKPSAQWERILEGVDVPAAAVVELSEVFRNPQFKARQSFVDLGLYRFVAQPAKFSTGSVAPNAGPPALNEHAEQILARLGYDSLVTRLPDSGVPKKVEGRAP